MGWVLLGVLVYLAIGAAIALWDGRCNRPVQPGGDHAYVVVWWLLIVMISIFGVPDDEVDP